MALAMTLNYSDDTDGARVCLERSMDLLASAVASAPSLEGTLRVVDLGAADGGTAMTAWRNIVEQALARSDVSQVEIIANDLPGNDFNTLGQNLNRLAGGRDSVLVSMVPRSFYEACARDGEVSLFFSATAMHWLRERPRLIANHTHANATSDGEASAEFAATAQKDWIDNLSRRARELAPGGQMVLVNLARDEKGRFLGRNLRDVCMHDTLHGLWKTMHQEGQFDAGAYERATFQNYYKSEEELTCAFTSDPGELREVGLEIESSRIESVPCVYRKEYDSTGNAQEFSQRLMRTVRSWSEHTFIDALDESPDASRVVDDFYERYRTAIESSPNQHSMEYVQSYLHIRKRTS